MFRIAGAAATAALLAAGVTACGSAGAKTSAGHTAATPQPTASTQSAGSPGSPGAGMSLDGIKLPATLPTGIKDVGTWNWNNWHGWAKQAFANKRIDGFWTPTRMAAAKDNALRVNADDLASGGSKTTETPAPVLAHKAPRPYTAGYAVVGKLYGNSPQGAYVCSATVVQDPAHPGKSNLVWTAGHCAAGGKGKGWYRNLVFVPAYNSNGKTTDQTKLTNSKGLAPYGYWWANAATTTRQWFTAGDERGGQTQYDYALLKVVPPKGTTKSLQETVGGAMPMWFNAPHDVAKITAMGYPAAFPYSGTDLYHCDGKPGDLSQDPAAPADYRIGCTMTGGSSGGGWFAKRPDGSLALVSNTSIGPVVPVWLAGPRLGTVAQSMFTDFDRRITG
ncbi:hypothetical protein BIV57_04150 [Mangrovactinospora gilvigrisea]|uniref:V8-like Glu-specific endopeptidase n=2 Tax=Mangrovactinospora gilvigrisea TaxID=1428644 RepID=A0A1J7BJA3_9ACTN|nr:hypothetical protein BIV57_04150 [Mangrovactinospora gilvigrisea]